MMIISSSTSLIFALQLILVRVPCNHHAFSIITSSIYTTVSPQPASLTTVLKVSSFQTLLSSTAKDDDNHESGGGGGWYDDYDDFVSNLNFEGGGWDNSGATNSASGANYSGGRRYDNNSNNRRDRNSDYASGGRGGRGGDGSSQRSRSRSGFSDGYNHDYQRDTSRDSSPIPAETMSIIENLLASRLQYRKKRMFDEADGVRDELLNVHGVTVWDKDKTWSTGGGGGGGGNGGGRNTRFNDRFDGRGRGAGSRGRDNSERGGGRGGGPRRENKFNEHGHDYSQVGGPINPSSCSLSESEIHDRIRSRMECKFARDFKTADRIEYELRQAGVLVHDGFKEWRADGDEQDESSSWGGRRGGDERRGGGGGGGGRFGGGPKPPKVYYQRGPGMGLSVEDIATINALVAERSEAKSTMDYNRADEIFDQLTNEYHVNIDDKSGEWALLHEEYQLNVNESAFVPDEKVQAMIGKKLGDRILARKARNFDLADDIRDELINDYVVEINDKTKEWLVVPPRGGQWSLKDDNDNEANIVSKQEWDEEENVEEDGKDDDIYGWTEIDDDDDDDDDEDDSVGVSEGDFDSTDSDTGSTSTLSTLNESALLAMTVPELKEKLREAGLPLSGKKSELVSRLLES